MKKIDKILVYILYYLCAICMFVMATAVTAQVISRYVFSNPYTWTEELGRYTFVWVTFLGMAVGVKHKSHIALDLLEKSFKGISKKILQTLNNLLIATFSVTLIYSGMKLVELGLRQTSPSLGLPMEYVYIVIPVSGLLMFYFIISELIRMFRTGGDNL